MSLPNRVDPFGDLFAASARGLLMGNRGGRIHDGHRQLGTRRWASKQWICCRLDFKDRHREVWGAGYTELFFLDEVTAFAGGHRPCFECRRRDAERFAALFSGTPRRASAPAIDTALHAERLKGKTRRTQRCAIGTLPEGTMIARDGAAYALRGDHLLRWTPSGYADKASHARDAIVDVLTPPSILTVLQRGYRPLWHASAG